jgi:hypothetical protein
MYAINTLLRKACDAYIASNTSNGSLGCSIREQLQQSEVLQQLSAVVTAITVELHAEAAVLGCGGWDAASGSVQQFAVLDHVLLDLPLLPASAICCGTFGRTRHQLAGCGAPTVMLWP